MDKIESVRNLINKWKNGKLTDFAALVAIDTTINADTIITENDVQRAKELIKLHPDTFKDLQ